MSRIYAVPYSGTLTTAGGNTDIWSIAPAANRSINLRGFTLGQTSKSATRWRKAFASPSRGCRQPSRSAAAAAP